LISGVTNPKAVDYGNMYISHRVKSSTFETGKE
jgi:hypothetical protein